MKTIKNLPDFPDAIQGDIVAAKINGRELSVEEIAECLRIGRELQAKRLPED